MREAEGWVDRSTSAGSEWEDPVAMLVGSGADQLEFHGKSRG